MSLILKRGVIIYSYQHQIIRRETSVSFPMVGGGVCVCVNFKASFQPFTHSSFLSSDKFGKNKIDLLDSFLLFFFGSEQTTRSIGSKVLPGHLLPQKVTSDSRYLPSSEVQLTSLFRSILSYPAQPWSLIKVVFLFPICLTLYLFSQFVQNMDREEKCYILSSWEIPIK